MFLFDFLFYNRDRHTKNILLTKDKDIFRVHGIDNGWIMHLKPDDELFVPYTLQLVQSPFHPSVMEDILKLEVEGIAALMQKHGMPNTPIQWMKHAAKALQIVVRISKNNSKGFKSYLTAHDLASFTRHYLNEMLYFKPESFEKVMLKILGWKDEVLQKIEINPYMRYSSLNKALLQSSPSKKDHNAEKELKFKKDIILPFGQQTILTKKSVEENSETLYPKGDHSKKESDHGHTNLHFT